MCPTADVRAVIQFLYTLESLQEDFFFFLFLQHGKLSTKTNISVLEWTFPGRESYKFSLKYSAAAMILLNL